MEIQNLQVVAGFASTLMFMTSNLPMLFKAYKTKNLKSYSLGHIALGNLGNLIYWLYLTGLPFGPVWVWQGFFTLSAALMLFWYLRYEKGWSRKTISLEKK
ncbi:MAG TPA: hypothetical protein VFO91_20140 [Anaerolineales bacterium]|nr:hypothetical protein [Anaerolineales bacterium]